MKNLLNCHVIGMHSFPIKISGGLYQRVFTTTKEHVLHRRRPIPLAIHPHHVGIKITVLKGELTNVLYRLDDEGDLELGEFEYKSHILGKGGYFEYRKQQRLKMISEITYKEGESFFMESCDMHTVVVPERMESAWLVQEELPTCDYFPVSYSDQDLEEWDTVGLYLEITPEQAQKYLNGLDYQKHIVYE